MAFNASCNPRLEIESSGRRCGPWALALGLFENWGVDGAGGGRCGGEEGGVEKGWSGVSGGGGARGWIGGWRRWRGRREAGGAERWRG